MVVIVIVFAVAKATVVIATLRVDVPQRRGEGDDALHQPAARLLLLVHVERHLYATKIYTPPPTNVYSV